MLECCLIGSVVVAAGLLCNWSLGVAEAVAAPESELSPVDQWGIYFSETFVLDTLYIHTLPAECILGSMHMYNPSLVPRL